MILAEYNCCHRFGGSGSRIGNKVVIIIKLVGAVVFFEIAINYYFSGYGGKGLFSGGYCIVSTSIMLRLCYDNVTIKSGIEKGRDKVLT